MQFTQEELELIHLALMNYGNSLANATEGLDVDEGAWSTILKKVRQSWSLADKVKKSIKEEEA